MLICQAITGHWIDEQWNLHEALLDFRHILGRHTGEHLGEELFEVLEYYDISSKLFCITADDAGNCGTMCEVLSKILKDEKGIDWNHKERYICCMNHVINLAVQDFLKSIKALAPEDEDNDVEEDEDAMDDDIALPEGFALAMWKIRELTKVFFSVQLCFGDLQKSFYMTCQLVANCQKISSSNIRAERFKECCAFLKLPALRMIYDVVTRWDSAYKMLARAFYLRKAIDHFIDDDEDLAKFKLTKKEWDQAAVIVTILLPFKMTSQRLQTTKRPAIDSVFWDYEALFNKIDAIKETFNKPEYIDEEWAQELHVGVERLSKKLEKYYNKTDAPFVYADSCILEPRGKLILFKQERFGGGGGNYAEQYKQNCFERYIMEYEPIEISNFNPRKHPCAHEESDDEDDPDDYRSFLNRQNYNAIRTNEFDNYIAMPPPDGKTHTLDYWKVWSIESPHLGLMARDTFAVPATGAGVERMFSKSGRVASWSRARLQAATIRETMLYKDLLVRSGNPLNEEEERCKAERRKERKKKIKTAEEQVSESENDEDDDPVLIRWEQEWWRKEGAIIITQSFSITMSHTKGTFRLNVDYYVTSQAYLLSIKV